MTRTSAFVPCILHRGLFLFIGVCCMILTASAQKVGIKMNTIYLGTSTPNLGLEFATADRWTVSLTAGYNPFSFPTRLISDGRKISPKLRHWLLMPEAKFWFCKAFQRENIGVHGIYSQYNIGGLPFAAALRDYRYQGYAVGGGLSYGYQWALNGRWGLEASIGVGYLYLNYKKYECAECGDYIGQYSRNYIGPTKMALSFIYYFK